MAESNGVLLLLGCKKWIQFRAYAISQRCAAHIRHGIYLKIHSEMIEYPQAWRRSGVEGKS